MLLFFYAHFPAYGDMSIFITPQHAIKLTAQFNV